LRFFIRLGLIGLFISLAAVTVASSADDPLQGPSQHRNAHAASVSTYLPLKDYVGVNVAVNNSASDIAQAAGWARDYHKWYWYEAVEGTYSWDSGWQYVARFYDALAGNGVRILPVVEYFPDWGSTATPGWINGPNGYPKPDKQANYLAALVARFGNKLGAIDTITAQCQVKDH